MQRQFGCTGGDAPKLSWSARTCPSLPKQKAHVFRSRTALHTRKSSGASEDFARSSNARRRSSLKALAVSVAAMRSRPGARARAAVSGARDGSSSERTSAVAAVAHAAAHDDAAACAAAASCSSRPESGAGEATAKAPARLSRPAVRACPRASVIAPSSARCRPGAVRRMVASATRCWSYAGAWPTDTAARSMWGRTARIEHRGGPPLRADQEPQRPSLTLEKQRGGRLRQAAQGRLVFAHRPRRAPALVRAPRRRAPLPARRPARSPRG